MLLAETLPHSLPWYFGLSVFIVWLAAMLTLGLLIRRRLKTRRGTRRARREITQPALGPGHDVEIW
jgi:hypothetical protein